jgi:hypothetical protein
MNAGEPRQVQFTFRCVGLFIAAAQKPLCENFVITKCCSELFAMKRASRWGSPFRLNHRVMAFLLVAVIHTTDNARG